MKVIRHGKRYTVVELTTAETGEAVRLRESPTTVRGKILGRGDGFVRLRISTAAMDRANASAATPSTPDAPAAAERA